MILVGLITASLVFLTLGIFMLYFFIKGFAENDNSKLKKGLLFFGCILALIVIINIIQLFSSQA